MIIKLLSLFTRLDLMVVAGLALFTSTPQTSAQNCVAPMTPMVGEPRGIGNFARKR